MYSSRVPGEQVMSKVQSFFSEWQPTPIVGPALVSPIKAAISAIQILGGIFLSIFFGCVSWSSLLIGEQNQYREFEQKSERALEKHVKEGVKGLGYSIMNICSLGILGYMTQRQLRTVH